MTIRAVLFDWSGTLFHDILPLPELIAAAAARVGKPISSAAAHELVARGRRVQESDPQVIAAERDRDRSSAAHRHADRVWLRAAGLEDDELIDAFYDFFVARGMRPFPDTMEVLSELGRLDVPVAVVSNCGWDIRRNFAEHHLEAYVEAFALSFEHGVVKPEPRLFELACELLAVKPWEALMVGDDPATDGGAVRAGIATLILPPVRPGTRRGLDLVLRFLQPPAA
jgi:HAD superfamily hydrolase (TIGR01493 family)